jgi:hypothetical protein
MHRRTLDLDGSSRTLTIRDEIVAQGLHNLAIYFHVAEDCAVARADSHGCEIAAQGGRVTLEVDPRLSLETLRGSDAPIGGWVSRGYHRKAAGTTLVGRGTCQAGAIFVCRVAMRAPARGAPGT